MVLSPTFLGLNNILYITYYNSLNGESGLNQTICDKCGVEIPDTRFMNHNTATEHYSGSFNSGNGVMLLTHLDLCAECAEKVKKFILK